MNRQLRRDGWAIIEQARASKGWSYSFLAERANVSLRTFQYHAEKASKAIEEAAKGEPYQSVTIRDDTVIPICEALDLDWRLVLEPLSSEEISTSISREHVQSNPLEQEISSSPQSGYPLETSLLQSSDQEFSFSSYIRQKTINFVGREYVFEAFKVFQKKYPKGYFSLVGDPGEGKSAIAAELVNRNRGNQYCLYHFNRKRKGPNTAEGFLKNICAQLTMLFNISAQTLAHESYDDGTYLQEILEEASIEIKNQKLIIIVDALDEVVTQDNQSQTNNILFLPETLPDNVYFFLTRRRDFNLKGRLDLGRNQKVFDFLDYDENTEIGRQIIRDVEIYVESYLNFEIYPEYADGINEWLHKTETTEREFTTSLTERSQRNFMYLWYVLPGFMPGGDYQSLDDLGDLPPGLMGYYWDHWERMGMTRPDRPDVEVIVIYLLTYVYKWVALTTIAKFASITVGRVVSEIEVANYFDRWQQFLHIDPIENEDTFRIYHESFNDFLSEEKTVKATGVRLDNIGQNYGFALYGDLDDSEQDEEDDDDMVIS